MRPGIEGAETSETNAAMSFSEEEIAYMGSQRLARIATVDPEGQPGVAPVGFDLDGTHLSVGGKDPAKTRKYRNVEADNPKVALVIDDLAQRQPWTPRFLRIYGTAELAMRDGQFGHAPYLKITPTISWSFNLDGVPFTHDRAVEIIRTVRTST